MVEALCRWRTRFLPEVTTGFEQESGCIRRQMELGVGVVVVKVGFGVSVDVGLVWFGNMYWWLVGVV